MTRPVFDVPVSLADSLAESGAVAVEVDPHEMMRRLQEQVSAQQALIEKLAAERGVPTNPRAALVTALIDHVTAQANANPWHFDDYAEVRSYLRDMGENLDALTPDHAAYLREAVSELREKHPQHELGYVSTLARDLHKLLMSREN